MTSELPIVPLSALHSSKLNPRQHFDQAHIEALAASLRKDGLLENLIVRPRWCAGTKTAKQLAEARAQHEAGTLPVTGHEIVSGECRFRAAKLAGLDGLRCLVRELTDPELEQINLTEQLHRNELTPMEEANSFARLLGYRGDDGQPLHTAESLAATLNVSDRVIYARLQLRKLPKAAAKAVESGELSMSVAVMLARIPDGAMREEATAEVLKGGLLSEPMTKRQAEQWIAEHCMRELKGAPFDQGDAELVKHRPEFAPHTSCEACAFRTGNNREKFGDVKRGDICTRPACYQAKVDAAWARRAAGAKDEGWAVMTEAESAREFPAHQPTGQLAFQSPYAKLDDVPQPHLLKAVVKDPPTWRELVCKLERAGMRPQIHLAKDQRGHAVPLVKVAQIVAGAEKAGEPVFREKSVAPSRKDPVDLAMRAENARLAEVNKAKEARDVARIRAVAAGLENVATSNGVLDMAFSLLCLRGGPEYASARLLTKALDLAVVDGQTFRQTIKVRHRSLAWLLMLDAELAEMGTEGPGFADIAKLAIVDLAAVDGAKPKPARKKRGGAADRAVAAVKASRAKKRK